MGVASNAARAYIQTVGLVFTAPPMLARDNVAVNDLCQQFFSHGMSKLCTAHYKRGALFMVKYTLFQGRVV